MLETLEIWYSSVFGSLALSYAPQEGNFAQMYLSREKAPTSLKSIVDLSELLAYGQDISPESIPDDWSVLYLGLWNPAKLQDALDTDVDRTHPIHKIIDALVAKVPA